MTIKKVLITGATGLVGRCVLSFLPTDYEVIALGRQFGELTINGRYVHIEKTNYSLKALIHYMSCVDVIIHMAASRPYLGKENYFANYLLDKNVFHAAVEAGNKRIVFLSSRSVYHEGGSSIPWIETSTTCNESMSYAGCKMKSEKLAAHLNDENNNIIILRMSQILSADEFEGGALSTFIKQAQKKIPIKLTVSGENFREYLYVKDAASAIWKAATGNHCGLFNLGSGFGCSIGLLAEKIARIYGAPAPHVVEQPALNNSKSLMNSEKFYTAFNWKPGYTIEQALLDIKDTQM